MPKRWFRKLIGLLLCAALLAPTAASGQTDQKNNSSDLIWIALGVGGLIYLLSHHHPRVAQGTPSPEQTAGPEPAATPVAVQPPPTPKPAVFRSEYERCAVQMGDGYMQPTQGIWQDDRIFGYPFVLHRAPDAPYPLYNAHYALIADRPTLIAGVDRYRLVGSEVTHVIHDRDGPGQGHIKLSFGTNCDPKYAEETRVEFDFYINGARTWTAYYPLPYKVAFYGNVRPGGQSAPYTIRIDAEKGWPASGIAFTPNATGSYALTAYVQSLHNKYWQDVNGLMVSVHGQIVRTHGLLIHYFPMHLSTAPKESFADDPVQEAAQSLAIRTGVELPDLYPEKPSGGNSQAIFPWKIESDADGNVIDLSTDDQIAHPEKYLSQNIRALYPPDWVFRPAAIDYQNAILAALNLRYSLAGILEKGDRVVVVLSSHDFRLLGTSGIAGFTISEKMIVVPSWTPYTTIGHELAHTLPWDLDQTETKSDAARVPWMLAECNLGYHNVPKKSEGLDFIHFGRAAERVIYQRHTGIMGPAERDAYIEQCTYRHLTGVLSKKTPDPRVFVVRGYLAKNASRLAAQFAPFYTTDSSVDAGANDPAADMRIVQRNGAGAIVSEESFAPQFLRPEDPGSALRKPVLTSFLVRVPYSSATRRIELVSKTAGLLAEKDVTAAPPRVSIVTPSPGTTVHNGASIALRWRVDSPAHGPLYASVFDSTDGGRSYLSKLIEQPLITTMLKLSGVGRHLLRVVVSDGSQSGDALVAVPVVR